MDGLVTACKIALDSGSAPQRHGSAPHVTVLVRDETLAQAPGAPPAQTGHGQALTARQVLAMCCEAQVSAIRWADGLPLDVGRARAPSRLGCAARWKPGTGDAGGRAATRWPRGRPPTTSRAGAAARGPR